LKPPVTRCSHGLCSTRSVARRTTLWRRVTLHPFHQRHPTSARCPDRPRAVERQSFSALSGSEEPDARDATRGSALAGTALAARRLLRNRSRPMPEGNGIGVGRATSRGMGPAPRIGPEGRRGAVELPRCRAGFEAAQTTRLPLSRPVSPEGARSPASATCSEERGGAVVRHSSRTRRIAMDSARPERRR
jgi:hypothetical protein